MPLREPPTATQPNAPQSIAQAARLWLHVVYPRELAGESIELVPGLVIGREPASEASDATEGSARGAYARIPHPTVSRRHAGIQHGFGVPILSDLGSSNGTRVNGRAVREPVPLSAQSVVRLGDTLCVVEEHSGVEADDASTSVPGIGPSIERVRTSLRRAAPESGTVLILGETGTGKEWLAGDVHRLSGRSGPYLTLSCAELSPEIIESQLFGHERGAFTGAVARHVGLFQSAHGGTLFLDEVGELPLEIQAKLLRVLQEGEVRPVGSVQTFHTDVRVVSATNRDLARAVEQGRFRRDLYARLSVFELRLPPLRERRLDILAWVDRLWTRSCKMRGRTAAFELSAPVAERIINHAWPDNLRGLDRLVQRLLSVGDQVSVGMRLLSEVLPELADDAPPSRPAPEPAVVGSGATRSPNAHETDTGPPGAGDPPSREEFLAVYEATGRNVRAVSKHFGRDRRQVYRWLKAFGIDR